MAATLFKPAPRKESGLDQFGSAVATTPLCLASSEERFGNTTMY
jgi:hypothetical protein